MNDSAIFDLVISFLDSQFAANGLTTVEVIQSYQPTQQGMSSTPIVYLHKLGDHRHGSPRRENRWDAENSVMVYTETQVWESAFQLGALSIQDPADANQLTASDLCKIASNFLQSRAFIDLLKSSEVQILRITDVRQAYFVDDRGRHEASPSFDFTLTRKQSTITTSPVLQSIESAVYIV